MARRDVKTYGAKRVTSRELTEIRTVLSRAETALKAIRAIDAWRHGADQEHYYSGYYRLPGQVEHTDHELSMMRSALMTAIDVLQKVELATGYVDDSDNGSGRRVGGGNSSDPEAPNEPGLQSPVRGAGRQAGDSDRPAGDGAVIQETLW